MTYRWNIGSEVVVLNERGEYVMRGKVAGRYDAGRYFIGVRLYDICPNGTGAKRLHAIPETQLRAVGKPILAYERKPDTSPRHIKDLA